MEHYFESVFIEQCAPTLAGLKPSSLFSFRPFKRASFISLINEWNTKLKEYGLSVRILHYYSSNSSFLVYVYRNSWVEKILTEECNRGFLIRSGYDASESFESILPQLSERLQSEKSFPHEIGLFLGYPLTDIVSFIEHQGQHSKCIGCWKCYGDVAEAQKCYERYRKCLSIYRRMYEKNTPISRLIVGA